MPSRSPASRSSAWSAGTTRAGPDEIALDVDTAEKGGFEIGDKVELATPGQPPVMEAELTGLVEFGSGGLNGATLTIFDSRFMQEQFFGGQDVFTTVSLNAADGVSQRELAEAAQKVLPDGVDGADRRRLRRGEQGEPRRDPRLPADLPAGLRRGLAGRRDLPHHQHLLDPGRPAQPGARAAARHGRLAPTGQPVGARSRRSPSAWSARRSASASATCSRSGCAGSSACSGWT